MTGDSDKPIGHKKLEVWNKAIDFSVHIYEITSHFPSTETYGLTSQLRRAANSIPANIAEGAARGSRKDYAYFVSVALGSASECETFLIIANKLKFLDTIGYEEASEVLSVIIRILAKLRSSLKMD